MVFSPNIGSSSQATLIMNHLLQCLYAERLVSYTPSLKPNGDDNKPNNNGFKLPASVNGASSMHRDVPFHPGGSLKPNSVGAADPQGDHKI